MHSEEDPGHIFVQNRFIYRNWEFKEHAIPWRNFIALEVE